MSKRNYKTELWSILGPILFFTIHTIITGDYFINQKVDFIVIFVCWGWFFYCYDKVYASEHWRYLTSFLKKKSNISNNKENISENIQTRTENIPKRTEKIEGSGTGFMISKKGIVVTNSHVTSGAEEIKIYFPELDKKYEGKIIVEDSINDLAVLKLVKYNKSDFNKMTIPYKSLGNISMGQNVHTIGFPLGKSYSENPRLSSGIINSEFGPGDDPRFFQTDIPIQPGNSGGVVFNNRCEIIGVISSSFNDDTFIKSTGAIAQNMNYGIKIKYIEPLLEAKDIQIDFLESKLDELELPSLIKKVTPFICLILCKKMV